MWQPQMNLARQVANKVIDRRWTTMDNDSFLSAFMVVHPRLKHFSDG